MRDVRGSARGGVALSEMEADFYDRDLDNPESLALRPLEESPWLPLYREAARWVDNQPTIDLGCGVGRFAEALRAGGHNGGYWGIDFSARAIEEAQRLELEGLVLFEQHDLREWRAPEVLMAGIVFVCLETLEHLDDDQGVVSRVPPGHRLILSVPNFGSAAHVRRFANPAEVWQQYDYLLTFQRWSYINLAQGKP